MPDRPTVNLFIYGTLKRGHVRHRALASQEFLGEASTIEGYRMFDCGSYPGMVESEGGLSVFGELWSVDAACLQRLDEIECVDDGLYKRRQILLSPPHAHLKVETYLYCLDTRTLPEVGRCWE